MIKADSYSAKGTKSTSVSLPKQFETPENIYLLSQAVRVYENRSHIGVSKTKTRGEIVASKRKIYRQKGTGRARHGALSAPLFVGGSKAHGPKGIKRVLSMPKKMRQKATGVALSLKAREGQVVVVNSIGTLKKTKEAANLVAGILVKKSMKNSARVSVVLSKKNAEVYRVFRNIGNVEVFRVADLNAHKIYLGGLILFDKEALKGFDEGKKPAVKTKSGTKKTKVTPPQAKVSRRASKK